mgnify:CR=1 FL=1
MKKDDQEITLLNSDIDSNTNLKKDNFKTTNVNILLNRGRLDKKRYAGSRIGLLARRTHKPEVSGSIPLPATI